MYKKIIIAFLLSINLFIFFNSSVLAANGAILYKSKSCHTCHGVDGKTPLQPAYPRIAGQNAAYLVQQIKDIRDGKRTNGSASVMQPIISNLRDPEIQAISDWLASQ